MMIEKHMQFQSFEVEEKNLVAVDPLELRFPKFKGKFARKKKRSRSAASKKLCQVKSTTVRARAAMMERVIKTQS
jgi:hypothetical protein